MDPEAFRREAHRLADWIADYLDDPARYPVLSQVRPGDIRDALPAAAPEQGESFDRIFADFERVILPGITHWNHPGFFAYFSITGSGPGILAEFLSAALNVQAMLWRTSPAATELEEVALTWLRQLLGLPDAFEGVIYDTASISTLHALAAAREAAVARVRTHGLAGRADVPQRSRLLFRAGTFVGRQGGHPPRSRSGLAAQDSGRRAISACGPTRWRARSTRTSRADRLPLAVIATIGTTSSTSVDPLRRDRRYLREGPRVAARRRGICRRRRDGARLRMDPAWRRPRADSLVVNPHKWLFTPFDLSVLYCRRMDVVRAGLFADARVSADERRDGRRQEPDGHGHSVGTTLSRAEAVDGAAAFRRPGFARAPRRAHAARARIRVMGRAQRRVRPRRAGSLQRRLLSRCVATRPTRVTPRSSIAVNASGEVFLSHTKLDGRYVLRLAIGNLHTTAATHASAPGNC